ncbi:MAG: hypothetical protein IT318_26960 [Anaerolineales bacterium]|nr:hypothetical protein [Anaerolineales bacterium]
MSTSKIIVSGGLPEAGLARLRAAGEAAPCRATTAAPPASRERPRQRAGNLSLHWALTG